MDSLMPETSSELQAFSQWEMKAFPFPKLKIFTPLPELVKIV